MAESNLKVPVVQSRVPSRMTLSRTHPSGRSLLNAVSQSRPCRRVSCKSVACEAFMLSSVSSKSLRQNPADMPLCIFFLAKH